MVCKLPLTEVGDFQIGDFPRRPGDRPLVEQSGKRTRPELDDAMPWSMSLEAALVERFVPMLAWDADADRARQGAAQLSPHERSLLCALSAPGTERLGSALATVFTRRFRSSAQPAA